MDPHASLSDRLGVLTDALDDPGTDLGAILGVLVDDLTAAVPSYLGLILTLRPDGWPVSLSAIEPGLLDTARASLRLPLDPLAGTGPTSSVVFYAAAPGAFVDLAAYTRRAYGLDGEVVLDGHLPDGSAPPTGTVDVGGRELGDINRAVGVLLDRGLPPEEAWAELRRHAADWQVGEREAAARILRSVVDADPPAHQSG